MRTWLSTAAAVAVVVVLGSLLSSCSGHAQPQGQFRFYSRPFQGVSASCWPLPTDGPIGFGWLPDSVTTETDRNPAHVVLEYQLFGPTPRKAVAEVVASLTGAGFIVKRDRRADEARLSRPDFGLVRMSARPLPDADPGVPVTALITFDLRLTSARPLLRAGLCHTGSGRA